MNSNPYTQSNVRLGALHYLMGRGAAGLAGFLVVLLLVRYMDVGNYAAYTALSGLVALSGILSGLGMERVVSRYVPEGRLYHSVEALRHFIWLTSAVRLGAALLVVLMLFLCWPAVDRFLSVADFDTFSVALACFIVSEAMFQHFSSVLQSLVMQKTLTQLLVIQWAGRLGLIGGFVVWHGALGWQDALWVFAIPEMLGALGFIIVIKRHLAGLMHLHVPMTSDPYWPAWRSVINTGMHNYGFTLLAAPPQGYFMKVLTAAYLPVEVVAAYGFFLSVAEKVRQYIPLHFFYGLLEPMMIAGYLKDRDFSTLSYRCQLLYKSNLLVMVPAIVWVAVAGDAIVGLMTGGKFQGLSWMLVLVMVQLTVGSHVVLLQLMLNSLEKSRILIAASVAALVAMLLVMAASILANPYWLVPTPIVFSLTMNIFIVARLARENYSYRPSWKMLGGVTLAGLLAYVAAWLLNTMMPEAGNSLLNASVTLVSGFSIYLLALWMLKAIDSTEVAWVKSLIGNMRLAKVQKKAAPTVDNDAVARGDVQERNQLILDLQSTARDVLDALIPANAAVALLDYPNNPNVGDSLIWLGEIAYLESRGVSLRYISDLRNYRPDKLKAVLGNSMQILLHGGGNFGTLWPEEHNFRLRILREFTGVPIVQFPQSIHFDDRDAVDEMAQAIRAHGNYTLLVRDKRSFDFAVANFECKVILCPDMAFFIGPLHSDVIPAFDRFILSRTDHEKFADWSGMPQTAAGLRIRMDDWLEADSYERLLCRLEMHSAPVRAVLDPYNRNLLKLWNHLAACRLMRGKNLLIQGRVVVSDRLHVHILSVLLGKPHVLLDNVSNKISSLHHAWTTPYRRVFFANDLQEALRAADRLDATAARAGA